MASVAQHDAGATTVWIGDCGDLEMTAHDLTEDSACMLSTTTSGGGAP